MSCRSVALIPFVFLAGCASQLTLPDNLTSEPTPAEWQVPAKALFRVVDSRGSPLGTFTLELTTAPADTCIAGTWLRAKPIASDLKVFDLNQWWRDESLAPSYQIAGRFLNVQLNGGHLCDDYFQVRAELTQQGGNGILESGGMFGGERYGSVSLERLQ